MGINNYGKVRFDEFVSKIYLYSAKMRKRSWKVDERIALKHLSPAFGDKPLSSLTAVEIAQWLESLAAHPYAPATCNRILAVLRAILNMAVKYGYLDCSPCANVPPFRLYNQRTEFLSVEEAKKIMKELRRNANPHAMALMLLLLTGARKSEILHARWEDVDLKRKVIHVPLSKSGKGRVIYLCDEAARIISELPSRGRSAWLFAGRAGNRPISDIYRFWNAIRIQSGLQRIRIHDLRHTYASILANNGHTLYEVQRLLGHMEPKTTMRYAHLAYDPIGKAAQTVGRLLAGDEENVDEESIVNSRNYNRILRWLADAPWQSLAGIMENAGARR